jgi:SSS family solute:Na+ symporter
MHGVDWSIIGIYGFLLIGIAVVARQAKSMKDFALGSRQIPGGIIFATLSATVVGPGYAMGLANKAGSAGYIWLFIFFAFSLQTLFVGYYVAPKLREFENAYTLADVMGYRYGKLVKVISGVLSVALSAGFVGVIARASGEIIGTITGIPFVWAVVASTVFVVLYSTFGGIKTVILTDVLQFIVLTITVPLILVFMIGTEGMPTLLDNSPDVSLSVFNGSLPPLTVLGAALGFLLGETLIPPYANRALMARDSLNARHGFLLTGAFSVVWFFICASIGYLAVGVLPEGSGNVYIAAMEEYLPIGLLGVALAALISIVMSSQDSVLNAAAVCFNNDILASYSPELKEGKIALRSSRWLNAVIGVLATVFAINVPGIVEALLYCYTLWAPTVVLPLIVATLKQDAHPYAAFSAIVAGGLATGIWEWGLGNPGGAPSLLVGVIVNQIVFWLVQALVRKRSPEGWFAPIDAETGTTRPIEA